jgi:hypothetical protein
MYFHEVIMCGMMAFKGEEVDISVDKVISEVESRSTFCNGFIHMEVDGCFGADSTNVKMPNKYI